MKMTCISGEKETIYSLKSGKDYYIDLDSIYIIENGIFASKIIQLRLDEGDYLEKDF